MTKINYYLFEPITLRSSINKYRNLSKHFFKASEKSNLVNLLIDSMESARVIKKQDFLIYRICSRHSLKVSVLREWIKLYQLGEDLTSGYCLSSFSNTSLDLKASIVVKKAINNNSLTNELIIEQRELTKRRRICEEQKLRRKRMVHITRLVKRSP